MNVKEFRESLKASIAQDRELLEKIEPVLQKGSREDPVGWKILGPLRGLKRTLLHSIKVHEKILAQVSDENEAGGRGVQKRLKAGSKPAIR